MNLYYRNHEGELTLVKECESETESMNAIDLYLNEKGYKSYYRRIWNKDPSGNVKIVDFGSHTEFFEIHKIIQ